MREAETFFPLVPAKAGTQALIIYKHWVPACAGMSGCSIHESPGLQPRQQRERILPVDLAQVAFAQAEPAGRFVIRSLGRALPRRALCTAAIDTRTIRTVKAEPGEPAASLPEMA